jgi:cell division protein FtsI (penicillin-binding protein 3)/stage V sporulation protein D (sporulation-specific penicillin-binding protein)
VNNLMRVRALTVIVLFAIGFTVVSGRLIYLQVLCHDKYEEEALRAQYRVVPIPAARGRIFDCQQRIFAQSIPVVDLYIDGKLASADPGTLDQVAEILQLLPRQLRVQTVPENRYILVQQEIDAVTQQKLQALRYRPLIYQERVKRVYPNGREASHVIGFTNQTQKKKVEWNDKIVTEEGMMGIEKVLETYLAGMTGERHIIRDKTGKEIPAYRKANKEPNNGYDVVLTLDQVIQHSIEEEADKLVEKYHPETATIIVLRPSTGEILGMTNRPTFDPNNRNTMTDVNNLRNCAISYVYEPGSTFKIVTTAAVLSEGIATLDTPIFCENGTFYYAGTTLTDTHPNATIPLYRALTESSNIAYAKLGLALGAKRLSDYVHLMGFGAYAQDQSLVVPSDPQVKQKLALPGEQPGLLYPVEKWSKISSTRIPIGYEIGVTNLQLTMAMGAIANGGKLMKPMMVKSVVDANGRVVREYLPQVRRQVITPEISAQIRHALEGVISDEGTAQGAKVEGYTAGGKTGTAKKWMGKVKGYEPGAYYSSFIGFVPADKPEFLISIMVNQPHGQVYGGKVAGPAFSSIATKVAQQLNMIASDQPRILAKGDVSR